MQAARSQVPAATPTPSTSPRSRAFAAVLWAVFTAGLVIQFFAPGLKIENRAFVMPPSSIVSGAEIRPDLIVQRERRMQWASGLCTVGGALALAFWYRRSLAQALHIGPFSDSRGTSRVP
jgi:hypothetical protein